MPKKLQPIIYVGNIALFHAREDFCRLVDAYNLAVEKINELEDRVAYLERKVKDE